MLRRKTSRYIVFGSRLRFLQDATAGSPAKGGNWYSGNIKLLLELLDELGLVVTARAATALEGPQLLEYLDGLNEDHKLTAAEAKRVSDFAQKLRTTLLAEASGHDAFIVSEKRMDVEKLLGDVGALFAKECFGALPEIAQLDFEEAGKCIAFERPTAAAFHLMRGTEATLREFYRSVVRRNRVDPLLWAPMVKHLRERRSPPPTPLLDNLDAIRRNFRNPTQHPEAVYEIDEAQDLFGVCIDVVSRMVKANHLR